MDAQEWCITLSDECTDVVREAAGPASFKTTVVDRPLGITLLVVCSLLWVCLGLICASMCGGEGRLGVRSSRGSLGSGLASIKMQRT